MADFNFEEYSDVFEDTQEPIDFEALSDIFEDTGVPTEEMAFESAMKARETSTATRSLTKEERAAKFPPVVQETIATEDRKGSEVGVMSAPIVQETISTEVLDKVEDAPNTAAALEIITTETEVPEVLTQNPVQYIYDQGFIGLDEKDLATQSTIVGFFNNSLGKTQKFATSGKGNTSVSQGSRAWCGTFVDHVLTNLGLPRVASSDRYDRVRARKYLNIGSSVNSQDAESGDIVVKKTGKQYHVGFFVGTEELVDLGGKVGIAEFQNVLMTKGYNLPKFGADGDFGSETISALKKFQKAEGLQDTGLMDSETFKSLLGRDATVVPHILMLGGNQSNEVNVSSYPSSQVQGIRRMGKVQELSQETFSEITEDIQKGGSVN